MPQTPLLEPSNLGDLLKYEAPNLYSREQLTVASGQVLPLGAVIGIQTASGKVKVVDPSATDGSQVAAGVLLQAIDAASGDKKSGIAVVRHAMVSDRGLIWPSAMTSLEKANATQQLKTLGVLVRKGV
jgi:hypothetical protein